MTMFITNLPYKATKADVVELFEATFIYGIQVFPANPFPLPSHQQQT